MGTWAKFCGWTLKKMGWTTIGGPCPDKKAIILGVPHTSAMDFVVSYLFYTQFNAGKARVMIKKSFFVWPFGILLKKLGGVPTDRSNATALVKGIIDIMEKEDFFILAIAPEGTRKATRRWKTGYHTIAKAVGCPVYMGFFDWGRKQVGCGRKIELTDDARADTDRIQAEYEKLGLVGKHPENYITH